MAKRLNFMLLKIEIIFFIFFKKKYINLFKIKRLNLRYFKKRGLF